MSTIQWDDLLAPIAGDNATGVDLHDPNQVQSIYYDAKDERHQARNIERKVQLGESSDNPAANWNKVAELSQSILCENSKDLEVATWLVEAAIRREGLPGLTQGLQLLNTLCNEYWDTLYPLPEDNDLELRLAAVTNLNGTEQEGSLLLPIRQLAMTENAGDGSFAFWQYQQALDIEKISDPEAKEERIAASGLNLASIQAAVKQSSQGFYQALIADIQTAIDAFAELTATLDEKAEHQAPPCSMIREALQSFQEHLGFLLQDSPHAFLLADEVEVEESVDENGQTVANTDAASKSINSREQALKELQRIAQFFKRSEPHSPVPYLLERAIRWGQMPLPQLLNDLIGDDAARMDALRLTGIHTNSSNNQGAEV